MYFILQCGFSSCFCYRTWAQDW